jgi:hypothetical protein
MRGWQSLRAKIDSHEDTAGDQERSHRGRLIAGGIVALVLAGAGGAFAATELDSPSAQNTAIISNAASQLGVSPDALSKALISAIDTEINAEVSAGTLSQSQATEIESRIASGQVPLFNLMGGGGRGVGGFGLGLDPSVAVTYLGLTTAELRTDMQNGQTLAQIAVAQGKTADGLVSALVTAADSKLASAVSAGKLTSTQESTIEANLQTEITAIVNSTHPGGGFGGGFGRFGRGAGGGLGSDFSAAATYLGLTTAQIHTDMKSGQTLAQIAVAQGKTADGLVSALVTAEQAKLASAVSAGKLTSTQESALEANLQTQITNLVNGTRPTFGRGGFGFGHAGNPGFGGGTGSGSSSTSSTSTTAA